MSRLFLFAVLTACASEPKTVVVDTVVLKSTWIYCWEKCGKKDLLAAVSATACICDNGGVIPLQPRSPEPKQQNGTEPSKPFSESVKEFFD